MKSKLRAVYVYISHNQVETTKELLGGKVYADLDAEGKLVGFEFLDPLEIKVDGEIK